MHKKLIYISQSKIPSVEANSIHVVNMCSAFSEAGQETILFCAKNTDKQKEKSKSVGDLTDYYGVSGEFEIRRTFWPKIRGVALIYAVLVFFRTVRLKKESVTYSRCLYSALLHCLFCRTALIWESHAPARTRLHRAIENWVIKSNRCINVVVITTSLKEHYFDRLGHRLDLSKVVVVPDAANISSFPKSNSSSRTRSTKVNAVYTGSLLPGKGASLVVSLAKKMSGIDFTIVGGSDEEIESFTKLGIGNLKMVGSVSPSAARAYQSSADILLLPNQRTVLCDGGRVDIGAWTSPLKLFEYMSSKRPIIASNLDVLKDVLVNERNCLLADPDKIDEWQLGIERLMTDKCLGIRISAQAYDDLIKNYTWLKRAERLLKLINGPTC